MSDRRRKGQRRASRPRRDPAPPLPPPPDLTAERFEVAGVQFVVLEYPVGGIEIPDQLTAAEAEVCRGLWAGRSSTEIAAARGASVRTVDHQIQSIYRKLGVNTREELLAALVARRR